MSKLCGKRKNFKKGKGLYKRIGKKGKNKKEKKKQKRLKKGVF